MEDPLDEALFFFLMAPDTRPSRSWGPTRLPLYLLAPFSDDLFAFFSSLTNDVLLGPDALTIDQQLLSPLGIGGGLLSSCYFFLLSSST